MRCSECNYPLWNLKARQCPECGTPFAPGEREFVVNSVRFCCPHCDQSYYGTGERGHLEPRTFECISCKTTISMDEMVLRPATGITEAQTAVHRVPWIDRRQVGFFKAWFRTIGMSMTAPTRLMRSAEASATTRDAWTFALLSVVLFPVGGLLLPLVGVGLVQLVMGDSEGLIVIGLGILYAAIAAVGTAINLLIWGLITHGMLRVTGGCSYTIGRTYQALCWSVGPLAITLVPCIGPYCGSGPGAVWQIVVACLMVSVGQGVHGGRATLAVLTAPVIGALVFAGGYLAFIALLMSTMQATGMGTGTSPSDMQPLADAVLAHAAEHDGAGPRHALELAIEGESAYSFVLVTSATGLVDIPVGDSTLEDVIMRPPNRRDAALRAVVDAMPKNVVAHRCGDFVFTYHGIDFNNADPRLWIVIGWPDPAAGNRVTMSTQVAVATADGVVTTMTADVLTAELLDQNRIRGDFGLAPLPGPDTVVQDLPAVAP